MKRKVITAMGLIVCMGFIFTLVFYLSAGESSAQEAMRVKKMPPKAIRNIRNIPMRCRKPDLAQWKANLPLGPKSEFPFSSQCKNCWEQIGVMNLPTMSVWLTNKGLADAPATQARLSWHSGKAPFGHASKVVYVPAIKAGEKYLLTINIPQGNFFQTAKPVTLQLDSRRQVDECNENNNTLTYHY